ncbi:uncharacterized protein [Branchiostoma lanceolatum]|uniref:uncharacterized protein n=1 Tax=Branchiostoma lanceolatum TaxID=7740 RepID=UPI0034533100
MGCQVETAEKELSARLDLLDLTDRMAVTVETVSPARLAPLVRLGTVAVTLKTLNLPSYGTCDPGSDYCMGRLPSWLQEDGTELLAKDSRGNVYKWEFDPNNPTAHAAWLAFYGHQETPSGQIKNNMAWMPSVLAGTGPKATQDSFMYRTENGVKSILLDDDNCDCYTSLNIGHGMCLAGHDTRFGPRGQYGVDALYDSDCNVLVPSIGLELYFNRT